MLSIHTATVALVGNPNTGKTTLFNALAGMRQHVGNYPGVTVETKKGKVRHAGQAFELIDLPGTYSLAPRSPDEMLAVQVILGQRPDEQRPDAVVTIVDASNLERNLYLVTQVMELGVPVIVALNMIDVAQRQGIRIDAAKLSERLGVPVVPIQANRGRGLEELKRAIADTIGRSAPQTFPVFPEPFLREVTGLTDTIGNVLPAYLVRRLLLDVGGYTEQLLGQRHGERIRGAVRLARQRLVEAGCPVPAVEARTRYAWIRETAGPCISRPARRPATWTDRLDRLLTHKLWGTLVFLVLMFVVFQSIFTWARPLMALIGSGQKALGDFITTTMEGGPLRSLLVDGVIGGVGAVLVFLPQILILFAFIAILEDCGYMARAAYLMDKLMARCGLNGKSFIPLLSSMACAVPGILAARVIENRRDRLATILVAPLMSCSARLPVYILLIGAFLSGAAWWVPGVTLFSLYALGLVVAPVVALLLKRTLLRGEAPVFVMEMPLYKIPSGRLVLRRAVDSGWMFLRRAGTFILATMILVWGLLYFPGGLDYEPRLAELDSQIESAGEEIKSIEGRLERHGETAELLAEKDKLENTKEAADDARRELLREWKSGSYLGQAGRLLEPVVRPLGWDWRIGMAALASFPAREVMVGTLGLIFSEGEVQADAVREAGIYGETPLGRRLRDDPAFSVPVALSIMVFFALCCQCVSTLAVIRRETNSLRWPLFTFTYMTLLAYLGGIIVYQLGSCML